MPGAFFPPPLVSDADMHHGTCMTHVPRCTPGSLTNGFLWVQWQGKRSRHTRRMCNPQFYVSGKRPITLRSCERHIVSPHWSFDCLVNNLCWPTSKRHQSLHYLAFVRGIHRWLVNSLNKGPVTGKSIHLMMISCYLHCTEPIQILSEHLPICWETRPPERPSCLHTTSATVSLQSSSHTAPHSPLCRTSTRPSPQRAPFTKRTKNNMKWVVMMCWLKHPYVHFDKKKKNVTWCIVNLSNFRRIQWGDQFLYWLNSPSSL